MNTKKIFALSLVALMGVACTPESDPNESFVNEILADMSIEEKVAQMQVFHANLGVSLDDDDKLVLSNKVKKRLKYGIAGIKNPGEKYSPERAAKLNNQLQKYIIESSPTGIPALFITESYNGVDADGCTRFARPITLASSWNKELVNDIYFQMGREARLRGLHMTHSPEADIARDPRFGRMSETFGEDTYLVTEMIANAVSGLQGNGAEGLSKTHIGAVVKHFVGYAQVSGGRNFASVEISPRTLIDEIMPPFKAAVERCQAVGVMASHGDVNGVSCHSSEWLLRKVLREEWGFDGYVVSDANDVNRLHSFMHTSESPDEAVVAALKAGMDIDLYGDDGYSRLPKMVERRPELITYIDDAVRRVLLAKVRLGLFENPYTEDTELKQVRDSKAIELAKQADRESMILLKNKDKALPLPRNGMTVALVGPNVGKHTLKYFESVAGDGVRFVVEKGFPLTNQQGKADGDGDGAVGELGVVGVQLVSKQRSDAGLDKILRVARSADVVILFVGGDPFTSREAFFNNALGDRADIGLVGAQNELIARVAQLGKPTIGVLKHRRTLAVSELLEMSDALVDCWEPSEFGDQAIAEVIFGDVNPSGKLAVTVPRTIGQIPFHYSQKEINYKKGYLFLDNSPLFPFGYGLSYTKFKYSDLNLSSPILTEDDNIELSVDVTNTGDVTGREVVQLYIKDIIGEVVRPNKELKGFEKITLKPGETKTVSFVIKPEMLVYTGLEMRPILDAGDYKVSVGGNSAELLTADFKLNTK